MEKYLTVEQVAEILQVSKLTVRRLIQKGSLPHSKVGKMYRIEPKDLKALKIE